jgi:hypothetical protein
MCSFSESCVLIHFRLVSRRLELFPCFVFFPHRLPCRRARLARRHQSVHRVRSYVLRAYLWRQSVILWNTCTLLRRVALLFSHHPQSYYPPLNSLISPIMSHTHPTVVSSSNFQPIFDNALRAYERRMKKDLSAHPLAALLQDCSSPSNILDVLQQQVDELNQSQLRNEMWTRWLDSTIKVVHAFSVTLGEHVTSVSL